MPNSASRVILPPAHVVVWLGGQLGPLEWGESVLGLPWPFSFVQPPICGGWNVFNHVMIFFQFNSSISPSMSIHNNHHSTPMLTCHNAMVRHQCPVQHELRHHQQHGHNSTSNVACRSQVGVNACWAFILLWIIRIIWCIWYVSLLLYLPVALMVIHSSRKLVNHSIAVW